MRDGYAILPHMEYASTEYAQCSECRRWCLANDLTPMEPDSPERYCHACERSLQHALETYMLSKGCPVKETYDW
jgi:hypothetical protein